MCARILLICLLLSSFQSDLPAQSSPAQSSPAQSSPADAEAKQTVAADKLQQRKTLSERAFTLAKEGNTADSIRIAGELLELEEQLFGESSEELELTLHLLTIQHLQQADGAPARAFANRRLEIFKTATGEKSWQTLEAEMLVDKVNKALSIDDSTRIKVLELHAEAEKLAAEKAFAKAVQRNREVVAILESRFGKDDSVLDVVLCELSRNLCALEKFQEAEPFAARSFEIRAKFVGKLHPRTAEAAWYLGLSGTRQEKHESAIEALTSARDGWLLADDREYAANAENLTCENLIALGRLQAASDSSLRAKKLFQETGSKEGYRSSLIQHANAESGLGKRLWNSAKYLDAIPHFQAAVADFDEAKSSIDAAWIHDWIGFSWQNAEDYDNAVAAFREGARRFRKLGPLGWPGLRTELQNLANAYLQLSRFEDAISTLEEQLELISKIWPPGHYSITDAKLAVDRVRKLSEFDADELPLYQRTIDVDAKKLVLWREGRYREALDCETEVADITRQLIGEQDIQYAQYMRDIGELHFYLGEYVDSEEQLLRSSEILKSLVGTQHPDYAHSLDALGDLYSASGREKAAAKQFKEALRVFYRTLGEDSRPYSNTLNAMAWLQLDGGLAEEALQLFQKGNAIHKRVLGDRHPDYIMSLNNCGYAQMALGNYDEAISTLEQVINLRTEVLGTDHPASAYGTSALAWCYFNVGRFEEADTIFQQTSQQRKKLLGSEHPCYAASLSDHGELCIAIKNDRRAAQLYLEAVDINSKHLNRTAALLTGRDQLALAQTKRWRLDTLLSCHIRLQNKDEEAFQRVLNWKGRTLVNQRAMREVSNEPDIQPIFEELQDVTRRWAVLAASNLATANLDPDRGQSINEQREMLEERKNALEAELNRRSSAYRDANAVVTVEGLKEALPPNAALIDFLEIDYGQWREFGDRIAGIGVMLQVTGDGLEITELRRGGAAIEAGTINVGDVIIGVAESDGEFSVAVLNDFSMFRDAVMGPENSMVRLLLRRLGRDEPFEVEVGRRRVTQSVGEMSYERRLLAFVVRNGHDVKMFDLGPVAPLKKAVNVWRDANSKGDVAFTPSDGGQNAGKQLRAAIWEPLLDAISGAETILVSPDGFLGRLPIIVLPGSKPNTYLLEDYRIAMIPVPQLLVAATPATKEKSTTKDLLLLGGVDYDARLGDSYRETSQRTSEKRKRNKPGDRGLESLETVSRIRGGRTWIKLPDTGNEVEFIRGLWTRLYESKPEDFVDLRGAAATEAAFRKHASNCGMLHLATHGFFAAPKNQSALAANQAVGSDYIQRGNTLGQRREAVKGFSPGLLSGLVFAGANHPPDIADIHDEDWKQVPDDGIMTADEIALLGLGDVRLVVLSACETGLGEEAGGEGLLGIQRAFQVSGAHATVATLWSVHDRATMNLMQVFYQNYLDQELSALDALREAQLWALNNPTEILRGDARLRINSDDERQRTPPFFWAAFTLSGD